MRPASGPAVFYSDYKSSITFGANRQIDFSLLLPEIYQEQEEVQVERKCLSY